MADSTASRVRKRLRQSGAHTQRSGIWEIEGSSGESGSANYASQGRARIRDKWCRSFDSGSPLVYAQNIPKDAPADSLASRISRELGDIVILQKGAQDIISNGPRTEINDVEGGLKRCGGQGDILSGTVGTLLAWGKGYAEGGLDG